MPIPATSISTAEIRVFGNIASGGVTSKPTNWGFYFTRTSTVPPLVKSQIDTAFQAAILPDLGLALNVRWLQAFNTIRFLDDALDAPVQVNHAVAGAVAGDGMPSFNSAFLLFRTGLRGKSFRGSKHFAPLSEADTTIATEDILNAAALTRFGAIKTDLLAGFTDASGNVWRLQVFSKTLSQVLVNPTTVVVNTVNAILINKRIGRMKRREVKSSY
jgi:hypothetical protein